jgi:hypothetical protein
VSEKFFGVGSLPPLFTQTNEPSTVIVSVPEPRPAIVPLIERPSRHGPFTKCAFCFFVVPEIKAVLMVNKAIRMIARLKRFFFINV